MPACGVSPATETNQPPTRAQTSDIAVAAIRPPMTYARYPRWTTNGANHTQWWLQLNGDVAADARPTIATANTACPRRYAIAEITMAMAAIATGATVASVAVACRRINRPCTLVLASGSCEIRFTSSKRPCSQYVMESLGATANPRPTVPANVAMANRAARIRRVANR